VSLDLGFVVVDRRARQRHVAVGAVEFVLVAAGHVRQVDGEAGVAAGGVLADCTGFEQQDAVVRSILGQPARRSEADVAATNHDPVAAVRPGQRRFRRSRRQNAAPAVAVVVDRKMSNLFASHKSSCQLAG
jgi:hypothetical protein